MAQYDGSIRINTEILIKSAEKQLKALENNMEKTAEKAASLRDRMEAMRNAQIPTREYKDISTEIEKAEKSLVKLTDTQSQMQREGKNSGVTWERLNLQIRATEEVIEDAKDDLQSLVDSGKAFTLGSSTQEYANLGQQLKYADASLEVMNQQHEILQQRIEAALQKETEYQNKVAAKEEERRAKEEARINAIQVKEEEKRAKEVAAIQEQEAEEQRLSQIRESAVVGNQRIIETVERRKQLLQEIADLEAAGIGAGYQQYDTAKQELAAVEQEIRDYNNGINEVKENYKKLGQIAKNALSGIGSTIKKAAISPFKHLGNEIKKAASAMLGFGKSAKSSSNVLNGGLKNILKYGLGIRSLYALFNKLRSAIKEGFSNLYNDANMTAFKASVDSLNASLTTLKNAFAAAFKPLVEIAIPYIQKAIEYVTRLADSFGQLIASLTGKKTYTKAIKQTASAFEDQAKVAEDAKEAIEGYLSPLDEINKYSDGNNDNLTSVGSVDAGGAGQMFEEVPIESRFRDLVDKLKSYIKSEDWEGLGAYIASGINAGLQKIYDVINWDNVGPQITYFVDAFTCTLNSLIDNIDWDLFGRTIGAGINTVVNTLNLLIEGIDWINLGKSFATGIMGIVKEVNWVNLGNLIGNKFMIAWKAFYGFVTNLDYAEIGRALADMINGAVQKIDLGMIMTSLSTFVVGLLEALSTAIANTDWSSVGKQIADALRAIDWMGIASGLFDVGLQLIKGLLAAFGELPAPVQLAAAAIGSFMAAFQISSAITSFVAVIKTVIGILTGAGGLSTAINAIVSALGGPLTIAIAAIIAVGALLIANWDKIKEAAGKLKDWLLEKWEGIRKGIDLAIAAIKLGIQKGLEFIEKITVKSFSAFKDSIESIILGVKKIFSGLTDFIFGIFTGNWRKAWDGIVNIFSGVGNVIRGIVNGILSVIESMANGVVSGINLVIRSLNRLSFTIPSWVPLLGGNSFGFNIPELSRVSIPKLATGAVIPANREFLAVLGDQKHGTNLEAPADLIEEITERSVLSALSKLNVSSGNSNPQTIIIKQYLDGKQVAESMVREGKIQQMSTGKNMFLLGAT